ncbi:MAG TPA: DUF1064 domain-containing protein [Terracidiphilus sp.]|nr:DUF1064 domain-containing protein [Terracidiphilus sp.]
MRHESKAERELWTAAIEGRPAKRPHKYHAEPSGKFASRREADIAGRLVALESRGLISDLRFQVSFTLVEGRGKLQPIRYVADFTWKTPDGREHIGDAKGYQTRVYLLKKKLMLLLHGLSIEEL